MKIPRPWLHAARMADSILFYPALLLVVWGELSPRPSEVIEGANDKLLHFIAYSGLAAMAAMAVRRRKAAIFAALGLIVLGGVLEIIQGFGGRDMSLYDEFANISGVLVGGFAARAIVEPLRRRLT
jgi:VanZ family protein